MPQIHVLLCKLKKWMQIDKLSGPLALLTWSSSKASDRRIWWVHRASPHSHPSDVPWRPRLARLHHWLHGNQGQAGVGALLGAGRLVWWTDLDCVCVGLHWLAGAVWPGVGWRRRDDERDVDLFYSGSGIWHRNGPLRSLGHSLESERKAVAGL